MSDRREEILYVLFNAESEDCRTRKQDIQFALTLNPDIDIIYNAMDENGRQMCMELLDFMAKYNIRIAFNSANQPIFRYKEEWISKKQLFENFL